MQYVNGVSTVYIRKFKRKLEQYNHAGPLPAYFGPMIGDKRFVRMLRLHKTSLIETLKLMPADTPITFGVVNPDNTGHHQYPRRYVVIRQA